MALGGTVVYSVSESPRGTARPYEAQGKDLEGGVVLQKDEYCDDDHGYLSSGGGIERGAVATGGVNEMTPSSSGKSLRAEQGGYDHDDEEEEEEEALFDYWEEFRSSDEDSSAAVHYYNHTTQEYRTLLPDASPTSPKATNKAATSEPSGQPDGKDDARAARRSQREREIEPSCGAFEGQKVAPPTSPADGPGKDTEASTGGAGESRGPAGEGGEAGECYERQQGLDGTYDDPTALRDQRLRALLVSLPAEVVDAVVQGATKRALLHAREEASAQAEARRRRLRAGRAQYRHTKHPVPGKVMAPSSPLLLLV